jgi:hypothetical protein
MGQSSQTNETKTSEPRLRWSFELTIFTSSGRSWLLVEEISGIRHRARLVLHSTRAEELGKSLLRCDVEGTKTIITTARRSQLLSAARAFHEASESGQFSRKRDAKAPKSRSRRAERRAHIIFIKPKSTNYELEMEREGGETR